MKAFFALFFVLVAGLAAETKLGQPLTLKAPVAVDTVAADPGKYLDKTVQVKGQVSEVCQEMGCWMLLVDPATKKSIRIKVEDGVIVFPKSAVGKNAVAEGKLVKIGGKKTVYQIAGTGAVILD